MTQSRTSPPRGIVSWTRKRMLPKFSKGCALLGLVILGLWITGRVLTDEYRWSQYLWWLPPIWMLGSAWVMLIGSTMIAFFARRLGGLFLRPMLLIACIGCTGYLVFGVWHMHRVLFQRPIPDDAIRIIQWNQSSKVIDQSAWAKHTLEQNADIVIVSNSNWGQDKQDLLDGLAPLAPSDRKRWVNYSFKSFVDPAHFRIESDVLIASRFPLISTGMIRIVEPVEIETPLRPSSGRGWVLFAQFDLRDPASESEQAEPFVIWIVDLPSDPFAWRQDLMRSVANAINGWNGQGSIMGKHVWETSQTQNPFPDPDLIIGDFNTLRGSSSLDLLAPNMTDAFESVGFGRGRSWMPKATNKYLRQPFKLADWHIDLSRIGPSWNPVRYQIENANQWGWTEHQMQILDIRPISDTIAD